jgi:MFS transporter, DHA3 family, macrolide efflux protein
LPIDDMMKSRLPPPPNHGMVLRIIRIKVPVPRIFHPLRSAPVALLWGGLSLSALGDQLYAVALTWIAVEVVGSNAGYLSALQALVVLIAVLGIGRWADRWHPQRSMISADLSRACILLAVVGVWLAAGGPNVGQLVVAIVVLAIGQAVFQPALQSVLPALISDTRLLPAANGLLDMTDRSARLLGPGLVALLAGILPIVHFLTLDACSFLASAAALLLITRLRPDRPAEYPIQREAIWQGIVKGCRAMAAHPLLGYFLATAGLLNGAWYAVYFLGLPLMIARHGVPGSGLSAYGLVLSTYGCTNLAATVFFGSRPLPARPQFMMFGGNLLVGAGLALLGIASLLPAAWMLYGLAMAAALGAVGGPMKDIPVAVLRQTRLRPEDRAAGMRAYMAASSAGTLLAMLLAPGAIALAGAVPVVVACGAAYGGVGMVGLALHAGWIEPPQEQAA